MVIYLGSLVQLCCREGGTLQKNITGICGECLQCLGHTGFVPAHDLCAFQVYTAQAPGCSAGELPKVGPGLCALPRFKPPRFRFSVLHKGTDSVGPAFLCPSLVRAAQATRCLVSALSQVCGTFYHLPGPIHLFSWVCSGSAVSGVLCVSSGELISECNPPGRCQPSRIPGRLGWQLGACSQFGGGCHLWG